MVSVTLASRYHPHYQSRSSMYIPGPIPWNYAELAVAVLISFMLFPFMLALTTAGYCYPSTSMILFCVVIVAVAVKANIFALANMAFNLDSSVNFSLKPCPH